MGLVHETLRPNLIYIATKPFDFRKPDIDASIIAITASLFD